MRGTREVGPSPFWWTSVSVVDQPLCDGEALRTRSSAAVCDPGEWSFLAIAARTPMEVWVGSH